MQQTDPVDKWVTTLLGNETFKPGLDRLKPIFSKYIKSFKDRSLKIITVAGTNGKGETAFSIECLLTELGLKTALWTSPHIITVNERFRFNGKVAKDSELLETFEHNKSLINDLSYYEFLLLSFCELAHRSNLDVIIFEVGLGGRLDAVNLFDADMIAITSISRDHEEYLGSSLKGILREKLGVARKNSLALFNIEQSFLENEAELLLNAKGVPYENIGDLLQELNLTYSEKNKLLALKLVECFVLKFFNKYFNDLQNLNTEKVLNKLILKGRLEKIDYNGRVVVFNGAHNIDGIRKLRDLLVSRAESFDLILFSPSDRKVNEIDAMVTIMTKAKCLYDNFALTTFEEHPRACSQEKLLNIRNKNVKIVDWKKELSNTHLEGKKILICGSYYFIGEVQKYITQ